MGQCISHKPCLNVMLQILFLLSTSGSLVSASNRLVSFFLLLNTFFFLSFCKSLVKKPLCNHQYVSQPIDADCVSGYFARLWGFDAFPTSDFGCIG